VKANLPGSKYIGYPDLILQDVPEQANVLEKFLVDFFHPSNEFYQRHGGGIHQVAGTIRADDHSAGFSVCAIVFRDEHL
jgi:hypothetical protein